MEDSHAAEAEIIYFELYPHPDFFKRCIFDAFLFNPACAKVPVRTTNSHAQSISPASCRSKRVDDHSRFYANFRDFRGARVSTLTPHVLKPNADPVVLTQLSSAAHELQRFQCSALFVVVAEQEILLNRDH